MLCQSGRGRRGDFQIARGKGVHGVRRFGDRRPSRRGDFQIARGGKGCMEFGDSEIGAPAGEAISKSPGGEWGAWSSAIRRSAPQPEGRFPNRPEKGTLARRFGDRLQAARTMAANPIACAGRAATLRTFITCMIPVVFEHLTTSFVSVAALNHAGQENELHPTEESEDVVVRRLERSAS